MTLLETKDFPTFNIKQLAQYLMTHDLHLGTNNTETIRPKSLALKLEEQEDQIIMMKQQP